MASTNLEVIISATDRFSGTANRISGSLNAMSASAGRVNRGVGQLASGLGRLAVVGAAAAAGGLLAAARAAGSFEAQLNTINTIARETPEGLDRIGDGIRKLAREGRGDLADLSAAYYDILSAGVAAADAQGVLEAASTLAIGSLSTNAEAVDLLTTAINAYGQDASAAARDADLFAKAVELGKVKADEIAASFANVAPIAAQQGIEIEEVAAAYAALTAQGVPAVEVTTQMQRAILDLLSPNKELNALQKETGVNFMALARDKGLVVALQAMRDAVNGDEQAFKDLFGRVEGYKFALQTTGAQQGIYNRALDAMGASAGTAAGQMGERAHGLAFAFGRLKANVTDALISVGSGFTPALERMADRLSTFLSTNRGDLEAFGRDIGRAFDAIDFDALLATIKDIARAFRDDVLPVLRTALDLFRALPGPIQGLGAAGLIAANSPLVGGALTSVGKGIGNIGMGLLGGAAAAAGKGTGLGRLFAQPVYVTNWPMGGIGGTASGSGGGGSILGTVAKVAVPVAIVGIASAVVPALGEAINPAGSKPSDITAAMAAGTLGYNGRVFYQRAPSSTSPLNAANVAPRMSPDERDVLNRQTSALDRIYDAIERNRILNVYVTVSGRTVRRAQSTVGAIGNRYQNNVAS